MAGGGGLGAGLDIMILDCSGGTERVLQIVRYIIYKAYNNIGYIRPNNRANVCNPAPYLCHHSRDTVLF